jgi:hypothetical protein
VAIIAHLRVTNPECYGVRSELRLLRRIAPAPNFAVSTARCSPLAVSRNGRNSTGAKMFRTDLTERLNVTPTPLFE